MQINSHINSLLQLEKKLEESTKKLAQLNDLGGDEKNTKQNNKRDNTPQASIEKNEKKPEKMESYTEKPTIPIAYSINSDGVSVQNTQAQTVLDITV